MAPRDIEQNSSDIASESDAPTPTSVFKTAAQKLENGKHTPEAKEARRQQYLEDRATVQATYETKLKGILSALKTVRGLNGEQFFTFVSEENQKESAALTKDGTYSTPQVQIAIAYGDDEPYAFKYKKSYHSPRKVLMEYASYTRRDDKVTHDIDMDLNGFFLTKAQGRISKRGETKTTYFSRPAIGIFMDAEKIKLVRFDKELRRPSGGWDDFGWGYNFRNWEKISIPTSDPIDQIYQQISEWIVDNAPELQKEDLEKLAARIEAPEDVPVIERISNAFRRFIP